MHNQSTEGLAAKVMNSFFPPILILLALLTGIASLWLTPKRKIRK